MTGWFGFWTSRAVCATVQGRNSSCLDGFPARRLLRAYPNHVAIMRLAILAAVAFLPAASSAQANSQAAPAPEGFGAPFKARPLADGPVRVGPAKGTVIVVGGGSMGPEIYK